MVVPKGGGGSGWHKIAMWQMHIIPSLWPIKCSGQGGERWNLCWKVGQLVIGAVCGSTQGWWWQRVAQNSNVANAYHTKSLADKVWWSRWREVDFMLEGWAIAYRSCLW